MEEEIRKQYEIETGKKWFTVPFTRGEQAFASWGYQLWLEKKISQVEPEVKVNFAEEIDKMLKNIEEYFETPNYKNNVVEYKSYYDGAYYYLKQLKNILIMKSKIST